MKLRTLTTRAAAVSVIAFALAFGACTSTSPSTADGGASDAGSEAGWSNVGGGKVAAGAASLGRIAVRNGKVFVAFSDNQNGGRLTVMTLNGSGWVAVGPRGFSPDTVDGATVSLALDDSGTPWVAFPSNDADSGTTRVSVMKWSGTSWDAQGGVGFAPISGDAKLVLSANVAYLAYNDGSALHVRTLAGTTWNDLGSLPMYASQLAIGADGATVYAAYDDNAGNVALAKFANGAWTTLASVVGSIDETWDPRITVSNGTVYLSYYTSKDGAVVFKLNGSSLDSVGALGSIANGDSIEYVSGVVYNGTPFVAFDDESRDSDPQPRAATVKRWDGAKWSFFADYPNSCDIENTMLTVDPSNGRLYLTYSDCDGDMTVQVY